MPLILGSNSPTGGYEVDNSLRFDDGSNDNLQKNFGTTVDSRTFTLSFWLKRSTLGTTQRIIEGALTTNPTYSDGFLEITSGDQIRLFSELANTARVDSTYTPLLRDTSAWYHIVLSCDTDQATASDRNILYINNTRYNGSANPSLSAPIPIISWTSSWDTKIGQSYGGSNDFDGYLAEFCFVEGQQLDPTSFGEFDEDSGIWKPIDVSGLTFGTNGFYLEFKDSSALGDDTSGNGNDFTVNNLTSIDQTTDTPTNNFATLNPLKIIGSSTTISEGNLRFDCDNASQGHAISTFAVSSGKWYWEYKQVASGGTYPWCGIMNIVSPTLGATINGNTYYGSSVDSWGFNNAGGVLHNAGYVISNGTYSSLSNGDIVGVAVDCDNSKLYFSVNGTFQGSSDPVSGTNAISITSGLTYAFGVSSITSGQHHLNFGSPIDTISSGNSDANGYGNFEYAVPSGYYALNSKNLAEYG